MIRPDHEVIVEPGGWETRNGVLMEVVRVLLASVGDSAARREVRQRFAGDEDLPNPVQLSPKYFDLQAAGVPYRRHGTAQWTRWDWRVVRCYDCTAAAGELTWRPCDAREWRRLLKRRAVAA